MIHAARLLLPIPLLLLVYSSAAQTVAMPTGMEIMQEVQRRHLLGSSIYEELTLILTDRLGNRDTRDLRRYFSMDAEGNTRFLILFDTPDDVRGVALLVNRDASGQTLQKVYLPASGKAEMQQLDSGVEGYVIGTDFSLEQMIGEQPSHYQYVLSGEEKIGNISHYLIDVYGLGANVAGRRPLRRHYVREDSYYITRTDYFDPRGRLLKQKTLYDLRQIGPESWRAGMILMENPVEGHRTLLKVNRTVLASESVPDQVFTEDWLFLNQPPFMPAGSTMAEPDKQLIVPAIEDPRQTIIGPEVH